MTNNKMIAKNDDYPVNAQGLKPLIGKLVCVLTQDQVRHRGILSSCSSKSLLLSSEKQGKAKNIATKPMLARGVQSDIFSSTARVHMGQSRTKPLLKGVNGAKALITYNKIKAIWPLH